MRWIKQNKDLLVQSETICAVADADNESAFFGNAKSWLHRFQLWLFH